ncbi:unnamed protein product [Phaeothamnion confervicola]
MEARVSGLLNTPARRVLRDRLITGGSAVAVMALLAVPAGAVEYSFGEIAGSVDTVISAGASMRTSDRNCENIGKSGGGCQKFDASGIDKTLAGSQGDDGNLNYDQWDVFSGALKATSEIQAGFRNFTAFVRGTAHVDPLVDNVDFRELEGPQRSEVSHNAKLLDYFVVGSFEVGELPLEVKVGNQVISWGESTFIQNGLNVINPIDISAIRKPGSEVKEFFVPILAAKASLGLPNNFSLESYYQFKSDNIVPDPSGTYFSSADIVGRGSQPLRLGISDFGDDDRYNPFASTLGLDPDGRANTTFFTNNGAAAFVAANPTSIVGSEAFGGWATPVNIAYGAKPTGVNVTSASIERANDDNAKNGGEFGVALRYFAEELNNGSEFGMFFVKYHSRLPLVSLSRINPATGYSNSTPGFNLGQFSAAGDPAHVRSVQQAAAIAQQNAQAAVLGQGAVGNGGLSPALAPYLSGVGSGAGNTAVDAYEMAQFTCNVIAATNRNAMNARGVGNAQGGAPTMTYRLQYPEDINLLGLSGSTTFGSVAVQAEATYRPDQPLQYALGEIAMPNDVVFARHVDSGIVNPIQNAAVVNEGDFGSDGFVKSPNKDVYTAQATATSILFGSNAIVQFARADQGVAVTEVGMVFVPGISTSDGFSSSNTVGLANYSAAQTYKVNADMLLGSNYATELSYGFQGIFNLTYNRAFGSAFNLVPQIAWRWDLGGRTPAPLGNYMAERKAIGLQLGANYQSRWQGSVSWTANFGPDAPLDDRDFASINVSYAF